MIGEVPHPAVFRVRFLSCARPTAEDQSSSLKQLWIGHVFLRFGTGGLQELVEAEELAAEGAAVSRPLRFAGIERECGGGPHLNSEKRLLGAPQFAIRVLHPP